MPPSKCGHGQDLASATVAHQITFALASNTNANLSLAKSEIGLTNGDHFKACSRSWEPTREHETRAQTRYRQAKETKRGGKITRKSESPIRPMKQENSSKEDPVEERGGQEYRARRRKR